MHEMDLGKHIKFFFLFKYNVLKLWHILMKVFLSKLFSISNNIWACQLYLNKFTFLHLNSRLRKDLISLTR